MKTDLYIIRHGEAHSNVTPIMGGMKGDQGLTERGIAQVNALARRLATGEIQADVLYASTLLRTRQTAEKVAEALNLPINWDDDLHELRPGDADGMHVEEARAKFERNFNGFLRETFTPIAPNGESWGSFQARVSAALERIVLQHMGQRIVIVAHGGVIEVSFLHLLGLGPQARLRNSFHVQNTAITHWRYVESYRGVYEWHLDAHNDHWHLRELDQ